MNCLGLVHHDAKLVAGCGDGRLYMFNWGEFGLHNADFPGHPDAINHLVRHNTIFQPVQSKFIAKAL